MDKNNSQIKHKLIVIGASSVGKTSLIHRLAHGVFEKTIPTVNAAYTEYDFFDGTVNTVIWDTAGQERYQSLLPIYVRNAAGIILVTAVDDPVSFEQIKSTYDSLLEEFSDSRPAFALGINKVDKGKTDTEQVENLQNWAHSHQIPFFFTSALDGTNVDNLFEAVASSLPKNIPLDSNLINIKNESKNDGCC